MARLAHCFAVAALALLANTLTGCGSSSKPLPPIGGFYGSTTFKPDSTGFAGLRVISDLGNGAFETLAIIGSDDGTRFWDVRGKWTDKEKGEFVAYFSHRNGDTGNFTDLSGTLSESGSISWNETWEKTWSVMDKPSFDLTAAPFDKPNQVGGVYKDGLTYINGTFKGSRVISANYFPKLTFVGTDDGVNFWTIIGRWDETPGQFEVDFQPIGGRNVTGTIDHDTLKWSDSTFWQKLSIKGDSVKPKTITV